MTRGNGTMSKKEHLSLADDNCSRKHVTKDCLRIDAALLKVALGVARDFIIAIL
jgi:hypothetical protein